MSNLSDRGTLRGTLQRNSGNYNDLINKPAINGHTLIGNQSGHALGLANEDDIINVEANPLGHATADLHKILVDDTIYSIPDVVVYGTASGAIASFDDGGDNKPLKSLKVAINPVQSGSGDPSPSNVRPIYGWTGANVSRTGKNLLNKNNVTFASGSYDENGNPISNPSIKHTSNYEEIKPNTTYTLSGTIYDSSVAVRIFYFDKNQNWLGRTEPYRTNEITFTTPNKCQYYQLQCSTNISSVDDWQLENGSSASQYEPYNGTTYPITWSEEGEVFGGTITVYPDGSGEMDIADEYIDLGTLNYSKSTSGLFQTSTLANTIKRSTNTNYPTGYILSSIFTEIGASQISGPQSSSPSPDGVMGLSSNGVMYFNYLATTDLATFKQAMDGVQFVYKIATPQHIDFPAGTFPTITSLLGNNNIWSDTGEIVECVYQRDLNIAINKALSQ